MTYTYKTRDQQGAALIVALIFLVVITLLGLSSIRTAVQEERMTSNYLDRNLAFQAAEAALRAGEAAAVAQYAAGNSGFPNNGIYNDVDSTCIAPPACTNGLCTNPDKDCTLRWDDPAFSGWVDVNLSLTSTVGGTPQYFVEYLGNNHPCEPSKPTLNLNCTRYRITARSTADGRAAVVLQSIFAQ